MLGRAAAAVALAALIAGCGSGGSGVQAPKIGAARTFQLAKFQPSGPVKAGVPTTMSFVIRQPSGAPLTKFKTGPGPHTGVHLIVVRNDLATIIHRHPPIAADGTIRQSVTFPEPGPYRVLVDVYPKVGPNQQPNFQLFGKVNVAGAYHPKPLPAFRPADSVDGNHFALKIKGRLKALKPSFIDVTVTDAAGRRPTLVPWYGALAHAVFFREHTLDYFHTHVCGVGVANCTSVLGTAKVAGRSSTPGKLTVGVLLPLPGTWRLFLQMKIHGRVVTAPFTLKVA